MHRIFLSAALGAAVLAAPISAQAYTTKTYDLPNRAYIHDVFPGANGLVYFTAQRDGKLGVLDSKTGQVRFVPLGPDSAPHGVIVVKDGTAWITDGGQNAIVHYDPKGDALKVYPLPQDTGYTNLNTCTVDGDGNVWFTGQNGIYGKVDVKTSKVTVWKAPKGRGPYGITTTPDGNVWYVSLAGSFLGQLDRKTGATKIVEPVNKGSGTRRVWSDSKGDLWISEWNGGNLSRYSPKTGEWKSWRVPGANPQVYAVYVDDKDMVWVSQWGANAVYSFDPKTEKFTEVPGSKPRSEVRQISGQPGVIWLPESGAARIMRIDTSNNES